MVDFSKKTRAAYLASRVPSGPEDDHKRINRKQHGQCCSAPYLAFDGIYRNSRGQKKDDPDAKYFDAGKQSVDEFIIRRIHEIRRIAGDGITDVNGIWIWMHVHNQGPQ